MSKSQKPVFSLYDVIASNGKDKIKLQFGDYAIASRAAWALREEGYEVQFPELYGTKLYSDADSAIDDAKFWLSR